MVAPRIGWWSQFGWFWFGILLISGIRFLEFDTVALSELVILEARATTLLSIVNSGLCPFCPVIPAGVK